MPNTPRQTQAQPPRSGGNTVVATAVLLTDGVARAAERCDWQRAAKLARTLLRLTTDEAAEQDGVSR